MKKSDMQVYHDRLAILRARVRGDVSTMSDSALGEAGTTNATASMPIHMAELGSQNFDQEFTLSLMQSEENALAQIDEAMHRIADGSYGKCLECGKVIPKTRLNAIPYAPRCVACAEVKQSAK